ncbi:MAG: rod shape-determining protein RodA, partial [Alphaproteobacteria bacterium]|nr:rod shape-determining protein RodA [Alphaproteobacteria bacterium]
MTYPNALPSDHELGLHDKLRNMPWGFVFLVILISSFGVTLLYSAGGASWEPWAGKQLFRMIPGLFLMLGLAMVDIRFWFKYSYVIYGALLLLLTAVAIIGHIGMGAQRWINFGFFVLQPSEHMKVALALALAHYFHNLSYEEIGNPLRLLIPAGMVLLPVGLILIQPNLGTATLTALFSATVFFLAGVRWWVFASIGVGVPFVAMAAWNHLHDYQKARLTTFLDPEKDPLGAGYNIIQSKIALGSGGLFGKGFGMGTQSQLNFLPEKHTDFIFVVLAEEMGLIGAVLLLMLFFILIVYGYVISLHSRHQFGRLLGLGLTTTMFLYLLTNVAMVTGLIPVVGIPLPLISYGGSVMLAFYIACGLLLS